MSDVTTLEYARQYLACGYSVIPVRLNGSKAPALKWERFQTAPALDADLVGWFGSSPSLHGIGLVQGTVSGHAEMLEFESDSALNDFIAIVSDHGRDDLTERMGLRIRSGGGGIHFYYRCPEGVDGNTKLARFKDGKVKIETRGEGGQVVAPGSPLAVHPTLNPYRMISGSFRKVPVISADDRGFLFAMARACSEYVEPKQYAPSPGGYQRLKPDRPTGRPEGTAKPGEDFAHRGDALPLLIEAGWTVARTRGDGAIELRRPGKQNGMSGTLHAVNPGVFYCFTTSAAPFENDRAYDAFQVYAVLKCAGDFKEAARQLGRDGFGDQSGRFMNDMDASRLVSGGVKKPDDKSSTSGKKPTQAKPGESAKSVNADEAESPTSPPDQTRDTDEPEKRKFEMTDLGNAERFFYVHGEDIRWSSGIGWLLWNGRYWTRGPEAAIGVMQRVFHTVRLIDAEAATLLSEAAGFASKITDLLGNDPNKERVAELRGRAAALQKFRKNSEAKPRLEAAMSLAEKLPGVYVPIEALDQDPWLLNCPNGTINLHDGSTQAHERHDLITKIIPTNYQPEAECPLWMDCLETWQPSENVRNFLRRAAGYTLTGHTGEETAFFLYGTGRNGKSKFIAALEGVMGAYSAHVPFNALAESYGSPGGAATPELAQLPGARFVIASEIKQNARLDESVIKDITGGDILWARDLYKSAFSFKPALKLWLYGNHKPKIGGKDEGIWARLPLIPWTVTIAKDKRDHRLSEKLVTEYPGILAWAVRGCLEWQQQRLSPPPEVLKASADYREEEDPFRGFFETCCLISEGAWASSAAIRDAFKVFSGETDDKRIPSGNAFGEQLKALGAKEKPQRVSGKVVRGWKGVGLIDLSSPDDFELKTPGAKASVHTATPDTAQRESSHMRMCEEEVSNTDVSGVNGVTQSADKEPVEDYLFDLDDPFGPEDYEEQEGE